MNAQTHKTSSSKTDTRAFLEKIVIDAGIGRLSQHPNFEEKGLVQIKRDIALITGQAPQERMARISIAGFKLREGQIVGLKITLRRKKMVDFFDRLIKIVLPRVRDFNGLDPKIIDQKGVLNIGFKDCSVFPEIEAENSPLNFSIGVSMVPKVRNREAALLWYRENGVPLKRNKK